MTVRDLLQNGKPIVVNADDWERAQEIAEMNGAVDPYGWLLRSIVVIILLVTIALVLLSGANF